MDNGPLGPKGRLRREAEQEWTIHNGQWTMENGQWRMERSGGHDASLGAEHRFARHGTALRSARRAGGKR